MFSDINVSSEGRDHGDVRGMLIFNFINIYWLLFVNVVLNAQGV